MARLMKNIFLSVFFLLPCLAWGQLFPKIADFHGNIVRITEKRFGKELNQTKRDSGIFKPGKYSGWKFTYFFDQEGRLSKRINLFENKPMTEYSYQRSKDGNRLLEREIIGSDRNTHGGECIEYENFVDPDGKIIKVNFWAIDQKKNTRELFLVEQNAEYDQGHLVSFTRHLVNEKGDIDTGETCRLIYDQNGRLVRIERKDIESELKTVLDYNYNRMGFLDHYSVDFMVGLPIYGKNPKQDIYYKCDKHGNWIRKYWLSNGKKLVEARRIIKYR